MMQLPHPDTLKDWHDLKAIKRGSMQAADDAAMEAYWLAMEAGLSKEEAAEVFSKTYKQFLNGK